MSFQNPLMGTIRHWEVAYIINFSALGFTQIRSKLECGPVPNVMAALPNIGGALCSMPQSLADAHY